MEKLNPEQAAALAELLHTASWLNVIPKPVRRTLAEVAVGVVGECKDYPVSINFNHDCTAESVCINDQEYDLDGAPIDEIANLARQGAKLAPEGLHVDPDGDFCKDMAYWAPTVAQADGIKTNEDGFQYAYYREEGTNTLRCNGFTHNSLLEG